MSIRVARVAAALAVLACATGAALGQALPTLDTTTQGSWIGVYGNDGYLLPAFTPGTTDVWSPPSYVAGYSWPGASRYQWNGATAEVRAVVDPSNPANRKAACAYGNGSFTLTLDLSQPASFDLSFYLLDWDAPFTRTQQLAVPGYQTVNASGYSQGHWYTYAVSGDPSNPITMTLTHTTGYNAVVSAVMFDNAAPPPVNPPLLLDLADMVKGGDGTGTGTPGNAIDPRNGNVASGDPGGLSQTNDTNNYRLVSAYPFIDGVFIPDGGAGSVTLNSNGDPFGGFPNTDSNSWDYIEGQVNQGSGSTVGGVNYNSPGHTMVGLHANKGITFDLNAIEAANPGYVVERFTAVAGDAAGGLSDFWVFVDDVLVASQTGITDASGAFPLDLAIGPRDRFLTLVATDGGNTYGYDQILFGDARLLLIYVPEPASLSLLGLGALALLRRRKRGA